MQAVSCYQLQQKGEMFLCHLFFEKALTLAECGNRCLF